MEQREIKSDFNYLNTPATHINLLIPKRLHLEMQLERGFVRTVAQ